MNMKIKLIRLILGSSVGSLLWAGCAEPQFAVSRFNPAEVAAAPVDQTKRRPDTHPEWRTGLWQTGSESFQTRAGQVVETTVVRAPENQVGTDSTYLLVFNPEVLNAASVSSPAPAAVATTTTTPVAPGTVLFESAGAERPAITPETPAWARWQAAPTVTERITIEERR